MKQAISILAASLIIIASAGCDENVPDAAGGFLKATINGTVHEFDSITVTPGPPLFIYGADSEYKIGITVRNNYPGTSNCIAGSVPLDQTSDIVINETGGSGTWGTYTSTFGDTAGTITITDFDAGDRVVTGSFQATLSSSTTLNVTAGEVDIEY